MRRRTVQFLSLILYNGYFVGFFKKSLYTGPLKGFCVPGLNCHSCPTSLFSCPIGILQNALASLRVIFLKNLITPLLYITGFFLLFGLTFGRFACGWVCPFGLLQELIFKPVFKNKPLFEFEIKLRKFLKFSVFFGLVIGAPIFFLEENGYGVLGFCKFLCPVGTAEAGYLNLLLNPELKEFIGWIFYFKTFLLFFIISLCIIEYRFFCKHLCPLGLIYGFFNKISWLKLSVDSNKCKNCKICEKICPMNVSITKNINSLECIRCLNCVKVCPYKAIKIEKKI